MKKVLLSFAILFTIFTTTGCSDLWEILTSEITLLYGRWDVFKIYVDDSEENYENTKYTYIFDQDGNFKFITRIGINSKTPTLETVKGIYTYDKTDYTIHAEFLIPDEKTNLPSSTIVVFKVKEITSKRLLVEIIEDDKDLFSVGATWDMNKNHDPLLR